MYRESVELLMGINPLADHIDLKVRTFFQDFYTTLWVIFISVLSLGRSKFFRLVSFYLWLYGMSPETGYPTFINPDIWLCL